MKCKSLFAPIYAIFSIIILSIVTGGCNKITPITPCPSDSINVRKVLVPNQNDDTSATHTYGKNNIIGNSLTTTFTTDSNNIFVGFNITLLELHSDIIGNLLSFIHGEMLYYGFINESDTIAPKEILNKMRNSSSGYEAAQIALDWERDLFYKEFPNILKYSDYGYNIFFELHPVFLNDKYVTYHKCSKRYTGGLHQNYTSFLQTYDLRTGESVDLEDMIKPEKMNDYRKIVVRHMASSYPIYRDINSEEEYLDSLNEWIGNTSIAVKLGIEDKENLPRITIGNYPLNDPGIHEAGLVITYDEYHLTPGSDGCPIIVITYDEIRDYLKSPFDQYTTVLLNSATKS